MRSQSRSLITGAPLPEPTTYAKRFAGKYAHRLIEEGIGHNLPQRALLPFAQAMIDARGMTDKDGPPAPIRPIALVVLCLP
jgi:hypothetical protein